MAPELCDLDEDEEIRTELANESDIEGQEEKLNRLDNFRQRASESCIFPAVLTSEYIEIAPGENEIPRSVILDKNCEEMAFPHLLSKGQFVLQQLNLNSKTNIAMKKFSSANVTAGMLSKNFKETVETLVISDNGFVFTNAIKETRAFWKMFQLQVLAIIGQLRCSTFFYDTIICRFTLE